MSIGKSTFAISQGYLSLPVYIIYIPRLHFYGLSQLYYSHHVVCTKYIFFYIDVTGAERDVIQGKICPISSQLLLP